MAETSITSTYVSQVAPFGFADAVDAADHLAGSDITVGRARLEIKERTGEGLAGAVWYDGVLHTGSTLFPTVRVDVVVAPWSAGRTEVGLRPLTRIGHPDSFRANRFFDAAWNVLPELESAIQAVRTSETPVVASIRVAA